MATGIAQDLVSDPARGPLPVWRRGHEVREADESYTALSRNTNFRSSKDETDLRQIQREGDVFGILFE